MPTHSSRPRTPRSFPLVPWLISTLALILLALAGWIRLKFGAVTFEQIITNLPISNGEGVGDDSLLVSAVLLCIALPVVTTTLVALVVWRTGGTRPRRRRRVVIPSLGLAVALGTLLAVAGVPQAASAMLDPRTIGDYYVAPSVESVPDKPRNLITVYLESTENTFADEDLFGENLLANLDSATSGWASYDLHQYPTGGWTMAGIVGTECGIPLKSKLLTVGVNPNVFGEEVEHYLPGATCLGDVLADNGYTNAFVGGAHTRFGGKDTLLSDHGYTSIQGLDNWEAAGEQRSDISAWGLSDARMFVHAQRTLDSLRATGKPFNLTILTLDTHDPGAVYPSCGGTDEARLATAIKCSGRAVAGFLDHLKRNGYLDDTVVVLMGDHVKNTGDSDQLRAQLESVGERTIYFRAWSPDGIRFTRQGADQLSMLPTTLELLGMKVPGGRAALGVSFVGEHDLAGTALSLPEDQYRSLLEAPSSELYQRFWES